MTRNHKPILGVAHIADTEIYAIRCLTCNEVFTSHNAGEVIADTEIYAIRCLTCNEVFTSHNAAEVIDLYLEHRDSAKNQ